MRKLSRWLGIAALVVFAGFVKAGDAPMIDYVDGMPEHGKIHEAVYMVWHDGGNDRWHVAVTTAGSRHHFKGRIWIEGDGKFVELKEWKNEKEKDAEGWNDNWFHKALKLHENHREIAFDLMSEAKGFSGFNFNVEGKGPILWRLAIGGPKDSDPCEAEPRHVLIGREAKHPHEASFQTWGHPKK